MIFDLISNYIMQTGPAGVLWLFLILHLGLGLLLPQRQGAPYLFTLMLNAGREFERRLNRRERSQRSRFMRGVGVALFMGFAAFLIGNAVHHLALLPYGWAAYIAFLFLCIDVMGPLKMTRRISNDLVRDDLNAVRATLQPLVAMPLDGADKHTLARRTIETVAASLNNCLVGPAFWFVLLGPVAPVFYVTYAALHQAVGLRDPRHLFFGRCVRGIFMPMNVVPALLTATLICVSSLFVSKSNPLRALSTLFTQGKGPNTWAMAAMAGGLGVTLGGPVRYGDDYADDMPWVGPEGSSAKSDVAELIRMMLLQYVFFLCLIVINSVLISMVNR